MDSRSRKMIRLIVAVAALAAAPLMAASQAKPAAIDGTWNMTVTGPDGSAMPTVTAVFKTEGKKLTGSLTSQAGETPLEGEFTAPKIAFAITIPQDSGPMNIGFAGSMKEDGTMSGVATGPFGELTWKAERAK
jgi:hypothetical protein